MWERLGRLVTQILTFRLKGNDFKRRCINNAIEGSDNAGGAGFKMIIGLKQRRKYPFLEPQIEFLLAKLERLKAHLMVMWNI